MITDKLDQNIVNYITDFLVQCNDCKTMNLKSNECCLCKCSFCNLCQNKGVFITLGYYPSFYCRECYDYGTRGY
jgi:hypothetical protein